MRVHEIVIILLILMKYATPLEILVRIGYIYVRARVRSLRLYIYQQLCAMGVNYVSMLVGRESYFIREVHLELVCNSSGAYAVYVYLFL